MIASMSSKVRVASRHNYLLLVLVLLTLQLALTFTCANAGLFEFIDKNKNSKPKPVPTTEDKLRPKHDRQADELAEELESLNNRKTPVGAINKLPRKPEVDLDTLLEMANENTRYQVGGNAHRSPRNGKSVGPAVLSRDIPADLPPEFANQPTTGDDAAYETQNEQQTPAMKRALRPNLNHLRLNSQKPSDGSTSSAMSKLTSATFLKKNLKGAYKKTKETLKPVKETLVDLPKYVGQATDSVSALLKLDKGSALREMMYSLDKSIQFVREEFSKFTVNWAPRVEGAINYIGLENLYKLKWSDRDELDLRRDALHTLGFGYEFMMMMATWRENLLSAHEAFRIYLQSVQQDVVSSSETKVDEYFLYQLEAIHNYMIFKSWLQIDAEMLEPRMKLTYLSSVADEQPKNYESDYFRYVVFFQELYEPTLDEFKSERKQVIEAVSTSSSLSEAFKEVDEFLDDFHNHIDEDEELKKRIQLPQELADFLEKVRPEVIYNPRLYQKEFLKDLKEAKKKLLQVEE